MDQQTNHREVRKRRRRQEAMRKKQERSRQADMKKSRNSFEAQEHSGGWGRWVIVVTVLCLLVGLGFAAFYITRDQSEAKIIVRAVSQSMLQGEERSPFSVEVQYQGNEDKLIDKEKDYPVSEFLEELRNGEGYQIECDGDGGLEGEFPIRIRLNEELEERLSGSWLGKVQVTVEEGLLTVKNKYGVWEGAHFKKHDGSYVKNEFIEFQGDRYYFDDEGNKVIGEIQVGFKKYVFDQEGKLILEEDTLDPDKPMIALTYDDGPGGRTSELLDVLEEYDAHATFFVLGTNINDSNGHLLKRMTEISCEVANHSYDHPMLTKLSEAEISDQINQTSDKVLAKTETVGTALLRPPYGAINDTVRQAVGVPMIMWSIDTLDWKTKDAENTVEHVMSRVQDGDIILMHDIHDSTIEAAKTLIPKLLEEGYQLVTISEMAEARGVELLPGESYSEFWR